MPGGPRQEPWRRPRATEMRRRCCRFGEKRLSGRTGFLRGPPSASPDGSIVVVPMHTRLFAAGAVPALLALSLNAGAYHITGVPGSVSGPSAHTYDTNGLLVPFVCETDDN